MSDALSILRYIRPVTHLDTASWAEAHVVVNSRGSNPGPWRRGTVAAMCRPGGPLEALDDATVETVALAKGAQTGGTYTGYCWLAKSMHTDAGSALVVMSTVEVGRKKAATTWLPMWEDSPLLKPLIPSRRRTEWTKLKQMLCGSPVLWIGANSPAGLASVDIRRLILDEVDKYPAAFGRGKSGRTTSNSASEAGAIELAIQRTKTFQRSSTAKIFMLSTPTDEQGPIWVQYMAGDQRKLWVPCWKCGVMQVMEWAAFKLDMELAKTAPGDAANGMRYECPHCKAAWDDEQRYTAIDKGEWRASSVPQDPRCRSFHMPSWASKFVTHSFLATKWIKAQSNKSTLHDFINGESAEPWRHYDEHIRDDVFAELEGAYHEAQRFTTVEPYLSQYQDRDSWVIGGVDVQKGYLVAVFRQFVDGGDSGLIWSGTVADFAALEAEAERHGAVYVMIDSRYRTHEVNEWAVSHRGYIPCQGVVRRGRSMFSTTSIDVDEGRRGSGRGRVIELITHDPDLVKDVLSDQMQKHAGHKLWMVPKGYAENVTYCSQMTAEKCISGHWVQVPAGKPNHLFDAEALALLGAIRFGAFRVGE